MAPTTSQTLLLSPAELSYLHTSLSLNPPIRPDARSSTQFRPLIAESDILPGTNGSARICFADGTEAVVGVKAEVEKSRQRFGQRIDLVADDNDDEEDEEDKPNKDGGGGHERKGENDWLEISVEIPGFRDDDAMTVFLAALLNEALLADGEFTTRLWINRRFHWKIYIDILLLSPPLSYPLPLLSLTTHLALLSTRLPRLKSEQDEDPLFDDDWDASTYLYPRPTSSTPSASKPTARPPITLLVMSVADNIIFDPSKEELAVAEVVIAVSVGEFNSNGLSKTNEGDEAMDIDGKPARDLRLLSVRTIDPPSRLTSPGVPNVLNTATGGAAQEGQSTAEVETEGVWQPPRGGAKRKTVAAMIRKVLEAGGVAEEVLDGLDGVDLD